MQQQAPLVAAGVDPRTTLYEGMSQIDHVRAKPHVYFGYSIIPSKWKGWILDFTTGKMKEHSRDICYPARHTFLEIISNAADNACETWKVGKNPGSIEVKADGNVITVRNFGNCIPIGKHASGLWAPEFIFGELLTSSNFSKDKIHTGGGTNGLGAKLVIITSEWFEVYIIDADKRLIYTQVWTNGMKQKHPPQIQQIPPGIELRNETRITYKLDFNNYWKQYGLAGYDTEWLGMLARHTADISLACKIPCFFNGFNFNCAKIEDYAKLYFPDDKIATAIIHKEKHAPDSPVKCDFTPAVEVIVLDTPNSGRMIALVNGIMTPSGGVHVDAAIRAVTQPLLDSINPKKNEVKDAIKLTLADVRPHISIIINCRLGNPIFSSQAKEKLDSPTPKIIIPESALKKVSTWDLCNILMATFEAKNFKKQGGLSKKARRNLPVKIIRAQNEGKRGAKNTVVVVEGDSAVDNVVETNSHLTKEQRASIGIFPFKGKILNAKNASLHQLMFNKELNDFAQFMGFKPDTKTIEEMEKNLLYHYIIMKFDADPDGKHITALFILWLHCRNPLFLRRGGLFLERTPLLVVEVGAVKYSFYSDTEYRRWLSENPNMKVYPAKHYKGLGTSSDEDIKDEFTKRRCVTMIYDPDAPETLDISFNEKLADTRKDLIANWKETIEIERMDALPITVFLNEEFMQYWKLSLTRSIPHVMDGLKTSQRQILHAVLDEWKVQSKKFATLKKHREMKVEELAITVAKAVKYVHGASSLSGAVFRMAFNFMGTNNMPYLTRNGQFGSRRQGGKKLPAARYPFTSPEPWLHYMYLELDNNLLPDRIEEGNILEKKYYIPIIPMQLVNGVRGVASGSSSNFPNFHPRMIITWYKTKNYLHTYGTPLLTSPSSLTSLSKEVPVLVTPLPWWREFKGQVEIKKTVAKDKTITKVKQIPKPFQDEAGIEDEEDEEEKILTAPLVQQITKNVSEQSQAPKDVKMLEFKHKEPKYKYSVVTKGVFTVKGDSVHITELPIGRWTVPYTKFLNELIDEKKLKHEPKIDPDKKKIDIKLEGLNIEATHDNLFLTKSHSMNNMVMLLTDGSVYKFSSVEEVLNYFFEQRHFFYGQRKNLIISNKEKEIKDIALRIKFQELVKERKIIYDDGDANLISRQLTEYGLPQEFNSLSVISITRTNVETLRLKLLKMQEELNELLKLTASSLWLVDLDALEKHYIKQYGKD